MTEARRAEPAQNRSRRQDKIVANIKNSLESYGYLILNMPIYEHYDLLKDTAFDFNDESIIRFLDRNTGKSLVLRPDFTPQVARVVTGYMNDYPLPLRLYYLGPVFRSVALDGGHKSEEYQIGWELIGAEELWGDMEMFSMTEAALSSICLDGYNIVVGDSMFLSRVMELAGSYADKLQDAIACKMRNEIENIATEGKFSENLKRLVLKLPMAFGNVEEICKLEDVAAFDKILWERLQYIFKLFDNLKQNGFDTDKIIFDPSETKGLGYYTGLNFKIVHPESGYALGGGGRYDNLMAKFGKTTSACGMGLRIDELMRFNICMDDGAAFDYLAAGSENFGKAIELRKAGYSTLFVADKSKAEKFLRTYKFKNVLGVGK